MICSCQIQFLLTSIPRQSFVQMTGHCEIVSDSYIKAFSVSKESSGAWSACVFVRVSTLGSVRNCCILQQQTLWYASTFPTAELENPPGKQEQELFLNTPHPLLQISTTQPFLKLFLSSNLHQTISLSCFYPDNFPGQGHSRMFISHVFCPGFNIFYVFVI